MDDLVRVEVDQGQRYVVGYVHLQVEGERRRGSLQKFREALVAEFHEQHGEFRLRVLVSSQVEDDMRVSHSTQEAAFCIELLHKGSGARISEVEESRVNDFGGAGKPVARSFADLAVGACTQDLRLEQLDLSERKRLLLPNGSSVHG